MIDHLLGRPSTKLKRLQVFSVIFFWLWFLATGSRDGPRRFSLINWLNRKSSRYSPWQIVVFTCTAVYAIRHLDSILGFGAPEPLARMYSRNFYRTTWIVTALDAGFATAMNIRPKWLRDILSLAFSSYYLIYANEADEKLRKFRAFCTVEMMRATWEKTTNPYIRAITWFHRPSLPIARPLLLPRPTLGAHNKRPIRAWLFYSGSERDLREEEELMVDFCGGGFICMSPQHHEERLRQLAREMGKPVLAIDYCKAPEYPYPFAIEECYDVYRSLFESKGKIVGMSGSPDFRVILSGDSAGGNIATAVIFKVIEYPQPHIKSAYAAKADGGPGSRAPDLPKPIGVLLSYPCLNFGFTSWMKPEHVRVLRQQSEVNLQSLQQHSEDQQARGSKLQLSRSASRSRRSSLNVGRPRSAERKASMDGTKKKVSGSGGGGMTREDRTYHSLTEQAELHLDERARFTEAEPASDDGGFEYGGPSHWGGSGLPWHEVDAQSALDREVDMEEALALVQREEEQRLLQAAAEAADLQHTKDQKVAPINTRLTMTSMAGYFQDRILTQGMMRAMAILYIGPRRQPDFEHDYFLSPIVAPARLLAEFPPVLFVCGEKDPLCDDTVVMAGRIREAKLAKKAELERRRAGQSARFGEQLRMSSGLLANSARHPLEDEDPEDWVQMRIIEGWSHGFLQMSSLMPEAKQVISFLSTWLSLTFEDFNEKLDEKAEREQAVRPKPASMSKNTVDRSALPASPPAGKSVGPSPVLDASVNAQPSVAHGADADDEEDDGPITFVTKGRRSPSRGFGSPRPGIAPGSPVNSPRIGVRTPEHAKKVGPTTGGIVGSPQVEALRGEYLSRARPASFSNGQTSSDADLPATAGLLSAKDVESTSSARRRSFDVSTGSPDAGDARRRLRDSIRGGHAGNGTGVRRSSKNGATALDEKYKSMLVTESNLLERRRNDVVFTLGHASALASDRESFRDGEIQVVEDSDDDVGVANSPMEGSRGRSAIPKGVGLKPPADGKAKVEGETNMNSESIQVAS
ncbi:alpha/beta-hydrolase [Violaceomyces palustris]|uniref:Alpha/beta-hydrolase n=1 Tax=Violaceomyces palustris TaxID=1673888 RepID=A0ACD0NYS4_9BASI|nr:alpha/beta-hydrolase [Violaceomyces palustris]